MRNVAGCVWRGGPVSLWRRQRGAVTGIEGAAMLIISIAGALVLAYMVINGGLETSQKNRLALEKGAAAASGFNLLTGSVVARDVNLDRVIDEIVFQVGNVVEASGSIDFTTTEDTNGDGYLSDEAPKRHTMVMSLYKSNGALRDLAWSIRALGRDDGDAILEPGEVFEVTLKLSGAAQAHPLEAYETVTVEGKAQSGAGFSFSRTLPPIRSASTMLNLN